MTKEIECPCKNCLIFPICRHKLITKHFEQVTLLSNSCSYLREYLREVSSNNIYHTVVTRRVFRLKNIMMGE